MQSLLPAGWLAFTGRELNPLERYKRFQITFSFPFSGFILAQRKFHDLPLDKFSVMKFLGPVRKTTPIFDVRGRGWRRLMPITDIPAACRLVRFRG
jgi:hypothetical protein